MLSVEFEIIQQAIGPNTVAIIWNSCQDLSQHPPLFDELDYFFDGLLTQTLLSEKTLETQSDHHFLRSYHFGKDFFLIQVQGQDLKRSREQIQQALKIIPAVHDEQDNHKKDVLFLNRPNEIKLNEFKNLNGIEVKDLSLH